MPKKHHQRLYTKPPSTAPSTFASASPSPLAASASRSTSTATDQPESVNDLLSRLRVSHPPTIVYDYEYVANPPGYMGIPRTVPPSLSELLGVNIPPAPRPRSRIIGSRALPRTTAGPPAPASWTIRREQGSNGRIGVVEQHHTEVTHLPGLPAVGPHSLMHAALMQLARNWEFHVVYDQYYLYQLRDSLKSTLLAYVGVYSPRGVGKEGLRVLFNPPGDLFPSDSAGSGKATAAEPADSWDAPEPDVPTPDSIRADITHLDLSRALYPSPNARAGISNSNNGISNSNNGNSNSNSGISNSNNNSSNPNNPPTKKNTNANNPPTKNKAPDFPPLTPKSLQRTLLTHLPSPPDLPPPPITPVPRFPNLRKLSLSFPSVHLPATTWTRELLPMLAYLPTLTHLSLAFWPSPPAGAAATVFATLARTTYCLKYVDLSGQPADTMGALMGAADVWRGGWRGVETVVWRGGDAAAGGTVGAEMPSLVVDGDRDGLQARIVEWRRGRARMWEGQVRRRRRQGDHPAPGRFAVVVDDAV